MIRSRRIGGLVVIGIVALAGFTSQPAVRGWFRTEQLLRYVPDLDRDIARHVVADSDSDWFDYCRRVGTGPLRTAFAFLGRELRTDTYSRFIERRVPLEAAMLRIGVAFALVYDYPTPERAVRLAIRVGPSRDFELRQLERRYIETHRDASLSADERIGVLDEIAHQLLSRGDGDRALQAYLGAAALVMECGRHDEHYARMEVLLRMARRARDHYMTCQILGSIAVMAGGDTTRVCCDEGFATALQHGFLEQAARFLALNAAYDISRGRYALALDRFTQAQRLCQMPGGETIRLRTQMDYTKMAARLGCWDLVERSLRRIPPMIRDGRESEVCWAWGDIDRLRARLAFATGQPEEGARLASQWSGLVPTANRRTGFANLFDEWSQGLESCGRTDEALRICERGIAHCDSANVPERLLPLLLRRARLLTPIGRLEEAAASLAAAESLCHEDPFRVNLCRQVAIQRARLEWRQGRTLRARREIRAIFAEFRRQLRGANPGPLGPLEFDDGLALRVAMHEIEQFSPESGYRFELAWRSLSKELGGGPERRAGFSWEPNTGMPPARKTSLLGTHIVYFFLGDVLLRWTATSQGVALDTLHLSAKQCLADVGEARALLETEAPRPGELLGHQARIKLERLASVLLPPSLVTARGRLIRLLISPDGPLQALPFEALWVPGDDGGAPLASRANIAYVNGWDDRAIRKAGSVVVVSNPVVPAELERRYGWAAGPGASNADSGVARARWPDAIVLSGVRATRDSVMAMWRGASIIYLAAHHVRDPDTPSLGFVPVAAPGASPADAAFLEIADIRSLNLSPCRLAILASCSSGAPYRFALRPGPSLGDAFLDSGAQAVMQSSWDVGDHETQAFMKAFLATWEPNEDDAQALGRARREVMATPWGASPKVWAAWSVRLTEPPPSPAAPLLAHRR